MNLPINTVCDIEVTGGVSTAVTSHFFKSGAKDILPYCKRCNYETCVMIVYEL